MVKSKHRGASSVQLEQPEWLNYVGRLYNTLPFLLYYLSHGSETWLPMRILAVNIQQWNRIHFKWKFIHFFIQNYSINIYFFYCVTCTILGEEDEVIIPKEIMSDKQKC